MKKVVPDDDRTTGSTQNHVSLLSIFLMEQTEEEKQLHRIQVGRANKDVQPLLIPELGLPPEQSPLPAG